MKLLYRWEYIVATIFILTMKISSAQNPSVDSLYVKPEVIVDVQLLDENLNAPERTIIDLENKDLTTVPGWKVEIHPKFNGPTDLSAFISDQIIEIDNIFGTKVKAGQTLYEVFIDTKGIVDSIKPQISGGEYLDNCFITAIQETSEKWIPASYNKRAVRTSIKIKVQYKVEWYTSWTKLMITAHEMR